MLSGGNIQKVIVARALMLSDLVDLNILIAFNPTRGLDYMTTQYIRKKLVEVRDRGKSVLLISEDLDESMLMCDRVYVMHQGTVVGEFSREEFDPYEIGALMVGLEERGFKEDTPADEELGNLNV